MDKKVPESRNSGPLPEQHPGGCVPNPPRKCRNTLPADFIKSRTIHPRRNTLMTRQLLHSAEICSRFEQLSGRGDTSNLDVDRTTKPKTPGREPQQPI